MFSHRLLRATRHRSPHIPAFVPLLLLLATIAATLLAGCGAVTGASGTTTGASATPTTSALPPIPGKTSIRPCPGPTGSASAAGTPALVFSGGASAASGAAKVGDLIQVRLPVTQHWTLQKTSASAVMVGQGGVQDGALNACVWSFRASAPGQITLTFVGTALCDQPGIPCPRFVRLAAYTVTVA